MKLSTLLLLLPIQSLGFAPTLHTSKSVSKSSRSGVLRSSPLFDDSPSPLQEEGNSPYDAYELGVTTNIVTKDNVVGNGEIIAENDDVLTVSVIGTVIKSGKQFLNNEKYSFELGGGNTFPGFNEGLLGSSVGTRRFIKVPPNKAYGQRGAKGIPPMSDLIFEVEVLEIARSPVDRIVAKVGTDRLLASAGLLAFMAISPFLPQQLPF